MRSDKNNMADIYCTVKDHILLATHGVDYCPTCAWKARLLPFNSITLEEFIAKYLSPKEQELYVRDNITTS